MEAESDDILKGLNKQAPELAAGCNVAEAESSKPAMRSQQLSDTAYWSRWMCLKLKEVDLRDIYEGK